MSQRYLIPLIVVAIAASLGSCSSNPTPTASKIDAETPTTTSTTNPNPIPSQSPSMAQLRDKNPKIEPLEATPKTETNNTVKTTPSNTKIEPLEAAPKTETSNTVKVTLYTSDVQCQEFIPQKVEVSATEPVSSAVGKIVQERDTADFSLSGYRVNVRNGVATVDLRLSPQSKRQIASLSSCEQFALFGSVRKTLMSNSQWKIKDVRFTEKGEDIVL
ncbi:sporulation/spore germination protein [Nostoc spongiaeforme FACHB-130]|uniref:Sporulation/spore germination protein n=1 Tax=Nostoc spongiaeforme FACHB-130 TaxID=1357510 RepID=A0ABR8G1I6_9NOSO|nr:sporulation/spore germination protein [Nostoc spongiaeforme]MBD2597086.1 sporulation/spore germination protein [Nostoc spongiaeforme FACHB-130]